MAQFRTWLRRRGARYILDVPRNSIVRDLGRRPPSSAGDPGRRRELPLCRADTRAARTMGSRRARLIVQDAELGPPRIDARMARVRAGQERRIGPEERLVVTRTLNAEPRVHDALCSAGPVTLLPELVRVRFPRHRIEEGPEAAKRGGPGVFGVRSWMG